MRTMDGAHHEVEVKLPFDSADDARRRLEAIGATLVEERLLETNVLFERANEPLKPAKKMLRLRRTGGRSLLTFKGPAPARGRYKVRTEHETRVEDADAMARVLDGLGFAPTYRYEKYRTKFRLEGVEVCLDETPLGCYVELEGRPEAIDHAASTLGFTPAQYVTDSYRALHREAVRRGRARPGDLTFERSSAGAS